MDKKISIVVPCYNEEESLEAFYTAIIDLWKELSSYEYELIFVDDGSKDETYRKMHMLHEQDSRVKCISFSRNFGKEAAIFSGLRQASGDCCVIMDADLQHPPQTIIEMLQKWEEGFEIIEGIKTNRGNESVVHGWFAGLFYRLMSWMIGFDMSNSSDFKLMDRKVIDALGQMKEKDTFFRALSYWVGFKSTTVSYEVQERVAGSTKWSGKALIKYAVKNLLSFTYAPLYIIAVMGGLLLVVGTILGIDAVISYLNGQAISGYPTIIIMLFLATGAIMCSLGIIATYLAKMYEEIKGRPQYIISRKEE